MTDEEKVTMKAKGIAACLRKQTLKVEKAAAKVTIEVRKPNRSEFCRVSKNPEHNLDLYILEYPFKSADSQLYAVSVNLYEEGQGFAPKNLRLCVERSGNLFVWPLCVANLDGWTNTWTDSALECCQIAEDTWVRMAPSTKKSCYVWTNATGIADEPKFPDKPFTEILEEAFKGRIIDSSDHEVLKKLRGEV
jgi:hypothetical protein